MHGTIPSVPQTSSCLVVYLNTGKNLSVSILCGGLCRRKTLRNFQTGLTYLEISNPVVFHEISIRKF